MAHRWSEHQSSDQWMLKWCGDIIPDYNQRNDNLGSKEDSDFKFLFRNQCDKCNKYFSRKCGLKRHKENCKGAV